MDSQGRRPAAGGDRAASGEQHRGRAHDTARAAKPQAKWRRTLAALLRCGPLGLNRYEAQQLGEPVLNTTIAQLKRRGLSIDRRTECVCGAFGESWVSRYALAPDALQRARWLLEQPEVTRPRRARHNALHAARTAP
jgi:hypothetical protein